MNSPEPIDALVSAHLRRTAKLPFSLALAEGTLPRASYGGLLRAMVLLEAMLERDASETPRSALIERDLATLGLPEEPDTPGVLLRAALLAQDLQSATQVPGWSAAARFAIAASEIGQSSFRAGVGQTLGLGDDGMRYLSSLRVPVGWRESVGEHAANHPGLLRTTGEVLQGIADMLETLYPLPSNRLRELTHILNAEAGNHAIPDDLREVQAALRAGETSLRAFPYYVERYGERGRRFTHSDSVWLVTLSDVSQPLVHQQTGWLGRVLASRGMPRWLLALHLDTLHDELVAALPERRDDYIKLHHAAERLHTQRRALLNDDALLALERRFDAQVDPEWQQRLPRTGALLGAAVADEYDGIKRAVTSLEAWFTDADMFPPIWIAAVQTTLAEARQLIPGRSIS